VGVHIPAEVTRCGFMHRGSHGGKVSSNMMLEAVLADVAQQSSPRKRKSVFTFLLPIIGFLAMLPQKMPVMKRFAERGRIRVYCYGQIRHARGSL
jgi:hypothetical protein